MEDREIAQVAQIKLNEISTNTELLFYGFLEIKWTLLR